MNETSIKNNILKYLHTLEKGHFWKINDRFTAGIPDILGCYRGVFIAIEVKSSKKKEPSKLQKFNINRIRKIGGYAITTSKVENVKKLIRKIDKKLLMLEMQLNFYKFHWQ